MSDDIVEEAFTAYMELNAGGEAVDFETFLDEYVAAKEEDDDE